MEAYADPWTGHIYISAAAYAGPIVNYASGLRSEKESTNFLFRSTDNGDTWEQIFKFGAGTPIVISSTPNGRLYLYSVVGNQPKLFYSKLGSEPPEFIGPKDINYSFGFGDLKVNIPAGDDKNYRDLVRKATNSISRISTDVVSSKVRLSYSWLDENKRTAIAVVHVEVPNDTSEPKVSPITTFRAADPGNSILASSFIEPDAGGATVARTNASVFYWVEGSTDETQEAYVRYAVFRGDKSVSQPAVLAGPYKPTVFVGDYTYGGSFFPKDGSYNYLAQWLQKDGIRANIVTIPPYEPGVKLPIGGGPFFNVDLPGANIDHIVMESPPVGVFDLRQEDCARACQQREGCEAWTYVRPNTVQGPKGNCWLKSSIPDAIESNCCVSGSVGDPGTNRPGGDYLNFDNILDSGQQCNCAR